MNSDANLHHRLDLHTSSSNGNLSGSQTTGSRIHASGSISLASDASRDGHYRLPVSDVKIPDPNQTASSPSFMHLHDSLSPETNYRDGDVGDHDPVQGQKKVKAPRLYHKKSRNGCQRCKARRVKVCVTFPFSFVLHTIDFVCVPDIFHVGVTPRHGTFRL